MPELFPAKLTVPASQEIKYDFTCENQTSVADFCQQVLNNTDNNVSTFELMRNDPPNKETNVPVESMTMGDLKAKKFRMRVNNKIYDVYPDLNSILKTDTAEAQKKTSAAKKSSTTAIPDEIKSDKMADTIPIGRAAILKDFYAVLLASMKKEAKSSNKLTKAQLHKAFQTSIKAYA